MALFMFTCLQRFNVNVCLEHNCALTKKDKTSIFLPNNNKYIDSMNHIINSYFNKKNYKSTTFFLYSSVFLSSRVGSEYCTEISDTIIINQEYLVLLSGYQFRKTSIAFLLVT